MLPDTQEIQETVYDFSNWEVAEEEEPVPVFRREWFELTKDETLEPFGQRHIDTWFDEAVEIQ